MSNNDFLENELMLESSKNLDIPLVIGEYEIEDIISESEKSVVFLVCDNSIKKKAMKCVNIQNDQDNSTQYDSKSFIHIFELFAYPEPNPRFFAYIMPFATCDLFKYVTLTDYFTADPEQTESKARIIMNQLFNTCVHLHETKICHGSITPHNILIFEKNNNLKVTFTQNKFNNEIGQDVLNNPSEISIYTAPELLDPNSGEYLEGAKYTDKVDSWSFGVVIYFILSGELPFQNDDFLRIDFGLPVFTRYSQEAKDLIWELLQPNPDDRTPIDAALSHPWFIHYLDNDKQNLIDEAMALTYE